MPAIQDADPSAINPTRAFRHYPPAKELPFRAMRANGFELGQDRLGNRRRPPCICGQIRRTNAGRELPSSDDEIKNGSTPM